MRDFEYVAPTTLEEAIRLMNWEGLRTKALAGGTDVLVQLRGRRFEIDRLVDVKKVPELNELTCSESGGLTVGAAVPCCSVYEDAEIQRLYPGMVDAASLIGGIQIQSRATIGGNLCNSAPSGDTIPAMMVHETTCDIAGPNGHRTVLVADFCTGPGQSVLGPGEILVALRVPPPRANFGAHFLRFIPRNEMDIAIASAGASVLLDGDGQRIQSAIIALGSVAPTPVIAREAMDFLVGKEASEAVIKEAGEVAKSAARPIDDMRGTTKQRIHLVSVLTKRALQGAISRARGEQ